MSDTIQMRGLSDQTADSIRVAYFCQYLSIGAPVWSSRQPGPGGGNSVATIAWHRAGNLRSRFTAFLTEDGEKPWRDREAEFAPRVVSRAALNAHWDAGWTALFAAVDALSDEDLSRVITIR